MTDSNVCLDYREYYKKVGSDYMTDSVIDVRFDNRVFNDYWVDTIVTIVIDR